MTRWVSFVDGNPVNFIDPSGHFLQAIGPIIFCIAIVAVVIYGMSVVDRSQSHPERNTTTYYPTETPTPNSCQPPREVLNAVPPTPGPVELSAVVKTVGNDVKSLAEIAFSGSPLPMDSGPSFLFHGIAPAIESGLKTIEDGLNFKQIILDSSLPDLRNPDYDPDYFKRRKLIVDPNGGTPAPRKTRTPIPVATPQARGKHSHQ